MLTNPLSVNRGERDAAADAATAVSPLQPRPDGGTPDAAPACGNGVVNTGEQCDDGNQKDGDRCTAFCEIEVCGDGVAVGIERCDDGNRDDGDGCSRFCRWERTSCANAGTCDAGGGSAAPDPSEPDANSGVDASASAAPSSSASSEPSAPSSSCSADCPPPACGNGLLEAGEECEPLAAEDTTCTASCALTSYCGDGVVGLDEECDEGPEPTERCAECVRVPSCGDGILDAQPSSGLGGGSEAGGVEACDDGNQLNGDGCSATCTNEPACGDGELQAGEQCDDGNLHNADACSSRCVAVLPPLPFPGQNLVDNANFDVGTAGWSAGSSVRLELTQPDVRSASSSSALAVLLDYPAGARGAVVSGAQQCVAVTGSTHYLLETYYRVPLSSQGATPSARVSYFAAANCAGAVVGSQLAQPPAVLRNSWLSLRNESISPSGALSARLQLAVTAEASTRVLFDAVAFGVAGASEPRCGDGVVQAYETCDDANTTDGDGCSATCTPEPVCGDGALNPGEACDDGNVLNGDYCSSACAQTAVCGDGVTSQGEECDGEAGCTAYCQLRGSCGDGVVAALAGEQCDQGAASNGTLGSPCTARCTWAVIPQVQYSGAQP